MTMTAIPVTATPTTLRHRAAALRALATTIEQTPAASLDQSAGDDTWRGPRPLLCHNILAANLAQLHSAVDDLRSHAWNLERQAQELERATAAQSIGSQVG
jgi:hypothetical protein